jgi:hypothetical protein
MLELAHEYFMQKVREIAEKGFLVNWSIEERPWGTKVTGIFFFKTSSLWVSNDEEFYVDLKNNALPE